MGQCVIVIDLFYGTLHMWARIDEEHNYKEKMFTFQTLSNDWPTFCHTRILDKATVYTGGM